MGEVVQNFYWFSRTTVLFLLMVAPQLLSAQDQTQVFIQGQVVGGDSLAPLPYVHIRGQDGRTGTATDSEGFFGVNVLQQDTIMFSSVGYKPYFLVPADSSVERLERLRIVMIPHVGELREITIKAYDNIEQFIRREDEPFSMKRPKGEPLFERKDPKEVAAVRLATGANGAVLEGGITAFANLFNSQHQQRKKLKEIMAMKESEARQQRIQEMMIERYQEMLVLADNNLSEIDIQRFTQEYMPPSSVMLYQDDYTVMLGILQNMGSFETEAERQLAVQELLKNKVFEGDISTTRQ
ncbi:carboxypeptidase-like regulatory domain-containing protein [Tunicatimonas pelagia]|uniref:carboxypeptidase-like regulatory domain-containing protein n=1 Tax=Tunicatimonas pelagia TaxID=931531 RepID=UPI0026652851|nr:carboxypeptidase-like regulatory domain-containing protein [Tunicatimonas pelagia]WKN42580.1 carboxypeptidase-like regulatory domain-containing protein [Tunicatimonas pelagia]